MCKYLLQYSACSVKVMFRITLEGTEEASHDVQVISPSQRACLLIGHFPTFEQAIIAQNPKKVNTCSETCITKSASFSKESKKLETNVTVLDENE